MKAMLVLLAAAGMTWGQRGTGGTGPVVRQQCSATVLTNCTPMVNGAGAVVPPTATLGTATNLAGGAAGQYPYQTGAGATGFRTPNAANGPVVLDASGNATISTMVLGPFTIGGTLPAAAAGNAGWITIITNGASTSDCTVGGGAAVALCRSTGAAWASLGGGGGHAISDEGGAALTTRGTLNFAGAGVTCADDDPKTTCTIPGGSTAEKTRVVDCTFDGGGVTLITNSVCYKRVPVAATIIGWAIEAVGTNPALTIDVLKIANGATLPSASIAAAALPALTGADNAVKSTTLTAWTTSITADDMVGFKVTVPGAATWAHISLYYTVN